MNEEQLLDKLLKIEALHAGATTPGEERAAAAARDRILARLRELEQTDPAVEYRFSMRDPWARKVFLALLRRYGLAPYRYPRQRRTTVMVRASERFVDEVLWPEFMELSRTLREYLEAITDRVIAAALHPDASEATEVEEVAHLASGEGRAPL